MTDLEHRTLVALAWMVSQYLATSRYGKEELDSLSMSAGEQALSVLAEYGLVELGDESGRTATWTDAGEKFLVSN